MWRVQMELMESLIGDIRIYHTCFLMWLPGKIQPGTAQNVGHALRLPITPMWFMWLWLINVGSQIRQGQVISIYQRKPLSYYLGKRVLKTERWKEISNWPSQANAKETKNITLLSNDSNIIKISNKCLING